MSNQKTFRFKSSCGVTATWRIGKRKNGKYGVLGLSTAKVGKRPLPLDFVPFEMSNAVFNGPSFDTIDQAETYARSI